MFRQNKGKLDNNITFAKKKKHKRLGHSLRKFLLYLFKICKIGPYFPKSQGLASYCKAETTFTFHFSILTLSSDLLSINNREMKSEIGLSPAMARCILRK